MSYSMSPQTGPDELEDTCHYACIQGEWSLTSGQAPEGYYCPLSLGGCIDEGEELSMPPVPIPPDPSAVSGGTSQDIGNYTFDRNSQTLYFRSGTASSGRAFVPVMSVKILEEYFPAIAAEIGILQGAKALQSFSVAVPSVDSATAAKLKKSS